MQEFYRSTIIQAQTKIRRERVLPKGGEIVVRVGQEVSPIQVVARTTMSSDFAILSAAKKLGVEPQELGEYLRVEKGALVEAGAVVASRKRLLGERQVISPVDGLFFDVVNGRIAIQPTSDWLELRALVAGRVVSYVGNRGVVLETSGSLIQAAWGSGKESEGRLKLVGNVASTVLTPEHLSGDVTGQVLAIGCLFDLEMFHRAEDLGVRGLVVGSATAEICRASQSSPLPMIVTDDIGGSGMTEPIFQLLQQANGRSISLFGAYKAAKGQRPEIILPQPASIGLDAATVKKKIEPGQVVRILSGDHAGKVGTIKHIYTHLQPLEIGLKVPGVDVSLADGKILFVPSANLDVIV
ncbi:MAG: KOW motif-containing protein [Anaerolineales bacterium]|nr:KOW motif-containing protein [Anaerolineales bacterium]MCB8939455.1 KOW motif-containing protein [Ardenticatenaceae bacterium]